MDTPSEMARRITNLDPNDEWYRRFKEAQQLVRQDRHEEAVPGEGAQQGNEGQHTGAQQANVGAEHHQLLLQQCTYTSQVAEPGTCCMQGFTACAAYSMQSSACQVLWCNFWLQAPYDK